MKDFAGYPITINYNQHLQFRTESKLTELHNAKEYVKEQQLFIKTTTTSDATIENNLWKDEIEQYESDVYKCLQQVERNPVGRMVLGLINKTTKVWIIPKSDKTLKKCYCAQTWPLRYEIPADGSLAYGLGSGDSVIQFRVELGDDTLLHELVHAYRYSRKKYSPMSIQIGSEGKSQMQNTEEFFAHQMETLYLSQVKRGLELDYFWNSPASRDQIYDFLAANAEILQILKYFLRHEYLAMLAANTFTAAAYNPFRDYKTLEARFLRATGARELPEFGMSAKPTVSSYRRP